MKIKVHKTVYDIVQEEIEIETPKYYYIDEDGYSRYIAILQDKIIEIKEYDSYKGDEYSIFVRNEFGNERFALNKDDIGWSTREITKEEFVDVLNKAKSTVNSVQGLFDD